MPHTGALARTAANIKLGALSPLAGIFKALLKIWLAFYLSAFLGTAPTACIGGLLLYVAAGMVKWAEVVVVVHTNRFHVAVMAWTAVTVVMTDFLVGVLSAVLLYFSLRKLFEPTPYPSKPPRRKRRPSRRRSRRSPTPSSTDRPALPADRPR